MNVVGGIDRRKALMRKLLEADTEAPQPVKPSTIPRRTDDGPAPLSFSQQRFWFLDRLAPGNPFYIESLALPLPAGTIDPAILEQAINMVVARHDLLRTRFVEKGEGAVQVVMPDMTIPVEITDLGHLTAEERPVQTAQLLHSAASRPFDLSQPPLLRFHLIRGTDQGDILAMAVHHIISDGWSMRVLSRETSDAVRSLMTGQPFDQHPLPIQYADYATWQQNMLASDDDPALSYWLEHLSDLPNLALPLDHPRPRVLGFEGAHIDRDMPANVSAGSQMLAKREAATQFMVTLAAFAAVLARHSGQDEVVIGTPVAGRSRSEVEPLIGLFLNTVVLRIDVSGDPTFSDLVARVRKTAIAAFERQDTPFERIVEKLDPDRDLGRNPLFQVLFQLFTPHDQTADAAQADVETIGVDKGAAILDLSVHLWSGQKGLKGRIEYSTELFQEKTVNRLFDHFTQFLGNAVTAPGRKLSAINMMRPDELNAVLSLAKGRDVAHTGPTTLPDAFIGRCETAPDACALIVDDTRVSYAELRARMAQIAGALAARGVTSGDRVVICLDRSPDCIAAMLAAMHIGAAYVPIDPGYPSARIRYVIEDSAAKVVVTTQDHLSRTGVDDALLLDQDPLSDCELMPPGAHPLGLAYVIYTSGSTGRPKGVMGTHAATMNRFNWMWREYPFGADETCCLKTAIAFVDSIWETFGPLLAGVPSVILDDPQTRDPAALKDALAKHKVSRLLVVPSLLREMLDWNTDFDGALPDLTRLFTSGERLPADLSLRLTRTASRLQLINLYGSSEVAGDVTATQPLYLTDGDDAPIGQPIDNAQTYVLDKNMRPVPPGAIGQLYVGGANLARGYLHQPGMTAERFVPDPFSDTAGARLFATGDLARLLPDGALVFVGRADHQVKIRGHRVEIGEVESTLQDHPQVNEAVVTMALDDAGGRLDAWITTQGESDALEPNDVRQFLTERLPAPMIPANVTVLDALQHLPNGKLDRKALADHTPSDRRAAIASPPETDTEIALAALWSDLLNRANIDAQDNFFDVGGHSLLATRLVTAMREQFDIELPLTAVFLFPTLCTMAAEVERILLAEIEALSGAESQTLLDEKS
ncbi:amino acid adenylation domain-containing protein [uncultured Tateyamaria sp.]|uniref:non-ribosomal peptide synthetase n=1 Tax=uncultured Tateyamaria sp. TaxID=455651 RepID=UPI0026316448|nr:amino acid adenylation domain-containing protein [uncultured Tateyamaria sp.]